MRMHKGTVSFYLFGDSICCGQFVSLQQTWATALARDLNASPGLSGRVLLQNAAVNGNTTRQALERMHYDVTSHSPDYVMVQFGMNDCNYWATDNGLPRVSQNAFAANLEEIVERALASGAHHCFLNTNHLSRKGKFDHFDAKTYDQSNLEYNELIRVVFRSLFNNGRPVSLIDMENAWKNHLARFPSKTLERHLLPDGIHLSVEGHELYKSNLIPKVVSIVQKNIHEPENQSACCLSDIAMRDVAT
jgi:lysophospholipase L1-like esterase